MLINDDRRKAARKKRDTERAERDQKHLEWLDAENSFPRGTSPAATGSFILGNYFTIEFPKPKARLFKYTIKLAPIGRAQNPPQKPEIKEPLIRSLLKNNPPSAPYWASDYASFIVSTEPLYKEWQGMKPLENRTLNHPANDRGQMITVTTTLCFECMVDLKNLDDHCKVLQRRMDITTLNDHINILNAISWKKINDGFGNTGPLSPDKGRTVGNKFYPQRVMDSNYPNVGEQSTYPPIYKIRTGFFTSIRPSQTGVLLNVNTTTSAFYSDLKLNKWMGIFWPNFTTSSEDCQRDFNKYLRRVKVTFESECDAVVRTIWSISPLTIAEQKFDLEEGKQTTVFKHLSDSKFLCLLFRFL